MKAKLLCLLRRFYDNSYVICMSVVAVIFLGILLFGCAGPQVKDDQTYSAYASIKIKNETEHPHDVKIYRIVEGKEYLVFEIYMLTKDKDDIPGFVVGNGIRLAKNTIYRVCIEKTFGNTFDNEVLCTFKKITKDETWRIRRK